MNIKSAVFFLLLCLCSQLPAQIIISGSVADASDQEPLIGVSIYDEISKKGNTSDIDGNFIIESSESEVRLVFSYVGYQTVSKTFLTSEKVAIELDSEGLELNEIVITGLGAKRQKRSLGYSTENFSGDKIAQSNASNLVASLSGKSAGINVSSANGVDGGTTRITIRGNNNIKGNNQPLFIIDGVPIENPPGLSAIGRGTDWGSPINNINPEDIADMTILKGPTASAKYGTRGANGVILITTKKGQSRKGLGIEYITNLKVITPYRYRDVQNVYGAGGPTSLLEPSFATNGAGEFVYPVNVHASNGPFGRPTTEQFGFYSTGVSWGPRMEGQQVRWWDGELRSFDPQPDNLKQFFGTGYTQTHNINISKGGDFGSVRASLSVQDHGAVVPNSDYLQYTFNLGSELKISEKLSSAISLSYIDYDRKNSPSLGDDNNSSFGKGILYSWPRSYKGLEQELNFNEDGSRFNYGGNYPFTFTPDHLWWNTENQNTYLSRNKMLGSVAFSYTPFDWLEAKTSIGLDFNLNQFEKRFNPHDSQGVNGGLYSNELDRNTVVNNDFLLTAFKDGMWNPDINVSLSFGGTQWSRNQYGIKSQTGQWENPWLFSFNNFSGSDINQLPLANEIRYVKKINSLYSFLNVDYKNMLFVELSGRNDWSSALPIENNSYFYPSASVSYIISESFNLPEIINFAKLRGSFAQTASDTDPFLLDFVYTTSTFNGQQTAQLPGTKPPSQLRPQQADSYELGLTLGFLNDRISVDFSFYQIESFDQILDTPAPSSSGVSEIRINNGVLENRGFELGIQAYVARWNQGYFKTGINAARNRNYVRSLGEGVEFLEIGEIWGDFGPKIMVRENEEYGTIYGYDYVYHENGQPILNDEGTHYQITENLVPVGNSSPTLLAGWTTEVKWKNFRFQSLVDSRIGGDIYAGSHVIGLQTGQSPSTLTEREGNGLPYTDPDGNLRNVGVVLPGVYSNGVPNEQVVHYYYKYLPNAGGWGKILTTPGILSYTWVKMRELSLSYSFNNELLSKTKVFKDMNISLVGRNLFYFYSSLPDRINPEGSSGSGNAQGLEWASFPSMRSVSLRIKTRF